MQQQQQPMAVVTAGQMNPASQGQQTYRPTRSNVLQEYNHRQSVVLGVILVITGALCAIFNIADLSVTTVVQKERGRDGYWPYFTIWHGSRLRYTSFGYVGHGFWIGAIFVVTGSLSIAAGRSKTKCTIIALLVFSIISTIFSVVLFSLGADGASSMSAFVRILNCNQEHISANMCHQLRAMVAFAALLALAGVVGFAVSIWGAILSGKAICRGSVPTVSHVVHYGAPVVVTTGQGPVMQPVYIVPAAGYTYPAQPGQQFIPPPAYSYPVVNAPPYDEHQEHPKA